MPSVNSSSLKLYSGIIQKIYIFFTFQLKFIPQKSETLSIRISSLYRMNCAESFLSIEMRGLLRNFRARGHAMEAFFITLAQHFFTRSFKSTEISATASSFSNLHVTEYFSAWDTKRYPNYRKCLAAINKQSPLLPSFSLEVAHAELNGLNSINGKWKIYYRMIKTIKIESYHGFHHISLIFLALVFLEFFMKDFFPVFRLSLISATCIYFHIFSFQASKILISSWSTLILYKFLMQLQVYKKLKRRDCVEILARGWETHLY